VFRVSRVTQRREHVRVSVHLEAPRAELEGKEVVVQAAEHDLQDAMKLVKREGIRNGNEPPNGRIDIAHRDWGQELLRAAFARSRSRCCGGYTHCG